MMQRFTSIGALIFSICLIFVPNLSLSADLPLPQGDIVLEVSGSIDNKNSDSKAILDLDMLRTLPVKEFETSTPWTDGVKSFTGVALNDFVAAVGGKGSSLRATALNDYQVSIPIADAVEGGPIIAYAMDGSEISVRKKGPLWIVYPYDSDAKFKAEAYASRSIWQLNSIEFVD